MSWQKQSTPLTSPWVRRLGWRMAVDVSCE
nr:MAG TPA: hypothetical protein [Caudoviricetes sp.]